MSLWAEAFRASVRSRDTVDTADTSFPRPPAPEPCVNSVMGPRHPEDTADRSPGTNCQQRQQSRATKAEISVTRGRTDLLGRPIAEGYRQAALRRKLGWDPAALPPWGCFCLSVL